MLTRKTNTESTKFTRFAQLNKTQTTSFERIASCAEEECNIHTIYINVRHPAIVEEESVQMRLSQLFQRTIVTTLRLRRRVKILIPPNEFIITNSSMSSQYKAFEKW